MNKYFMKIMKFTALLLSFTMLIAFCIPMMDVEAKSKRSKMHTDPRRIVYGKTTGKTIRYKAQSKIVNDRLMMNGQANELVYDCDHFIKDMDELTLQLSKLFYLEQTELKLQNKNDVYNDIIAKYYNWPSKWGNYKLTEVFYPMTYMFGNGWFQVYNDNGEIIDDIPYYKVELNYTDDQMRACMECKRIAEKLKKEYPNAKNEEYMQYAADYLRGISTYKLKNYDMEQLLFEGEGNCQAHTDCMDWIAKWLYIPDVQVDNREINHTWNMFYGSDGKLWMIDATNGFEAVHKSEADTTKFRKIEFEEVEIFDLNWEAKLIDMYRNNSEATTETEKPTETPTPTSEPITGPAITVTITPTPEPEPTETPTPTEQPSPTPTEEPTPISEPEPTPTVIQPTPTETIVEIGTTGEPGTITEVDDEEAMLIVKPAKEPVSVKVSSAEIGARMLKLEFTKIKHGKYQIRYRRQNNDWTLIESAGTTGTYKLDFLQPNTVYYVQVRNVLYGSYGWNNYGEWSKAYKITTEEG